MTKKDEQHFSRLKWACRRGMLELDVLLGNFLDKGYFKLSSAEKVQFERLLETPDPVLFAWLVGQEKPEDEAFLMIIEKMKNYAIS